MALGLLALPREVGIHPETGDIITAANINNCNVTYGGEAKEESKDSPTSPPTSTLASGASTPRENTDFEADSEREMIGEQQRHSGSVEMCARCIICTDITSGPFHWYIDKTAAIHSGTGTGMLPPIIPTRYTKGKGKGKNKR